jgi:hypothetical protein
MALRWSKDSMEMVEVPEVDAFIAEILSVCKKHNLAISHEDGHGAFIIERGYSDVNAEWLQQAMFFDGRPKSRQ